MLYSYLDVKFVVLRAANGNRYTVGNDTRLISLGLIALFSNSKLTTNNGKHLKDISIADFVSLMYKLKISSRDGNDLSIGFDRDRNRRQRELTNNKNQKK